MSRLAGSLYERRVCRWSVCAAACLHLGVVVFLILTGTAQTENRYQALAVMEFARFDPEGGEPGGGDEDETTAAPEPAPAAAAEPEPRELEPKPQVVESVSEKAAPLPPPPPPEKPKAKPKPKPKSKPQAAANPASSGDPAKAGQQETMGGAPGGGPGVGQGGSGGGSGQGNRDAFKAYTSAIQKKLNRYKKYPPGAQARKLAGVVTVNFTVNRQGEVTHSRLVKSSGHPELDEEVMALLKRVSPFPPMPREMTQTSINLNVPIQFALR